VKQCDLKSDEDRILTSLVVLFTLNKDVQERLLREDLSLEKTLQYCGAVEAAEQNRKELEQSIEADKVWQMENKTKCKGTYYNNYNTVKKNTENHKYKHNKNIKYNESNIENSDKSGKEYKCQ